MSLLDGSISDNPSDNTITLAVVVISANDTTYLKCQSKKIFATHSNRIH